MPEAQWGARAWGLHFQHSPLTWWLGPACYRSPLCTPLGWEVSPCSAVSSLFLESLAPLTVAWSPEMGVLLCVVWDRNQVPPLEPGPRVSSHVCADGHGFVLSIFNLILVIYVVLENCRCHREYRMYCHFQSPPLPCFSPPLCSWAFVVFLSPLICLFVYLFI